jgi:DNA-directed RNA polymerase specialized sigma24 family protein
MMSKQEKFARRSAMGMMYEDGYTLREIGERFGCSTDAVRININKINRMSKTPFKKKSLD